jgi:Na+/melibiose symporter-like transporter
MFSSALVTANAMSWLLYFYSPPPSAVDAGLVFLAAGVAVGFARLFGSSVDALTNPLVAFWSDRSTNPAGRRIPFIRRGTIPLMLLAVLIWFPPVRGVSGWNALYLAITLGGTWFFYTYVVAPYLALMPEITTHPEERVSLTVVMSYFEAVAGVIAALAVPPIIEALRGGVQLGPLFLADGFKVTAIVLALVGGIGFFVSISRVREKVLPEERRVTFSLARSVAECFRNPAFVPYLLAAASAKIAVGILLICMPFVATAVLHKGEGFTAILQAPLFLSTIIGFAVAQAVVNRFGLKRAFLASTGVATVLVAGFFGVYFLGGASVPLTSATVLDRGDMLLEFEGQEVRLTALEWDALFFEPDMEGFRKHVADAPPGAARAMLRPDTASARPDATDREREWLVEADAATLARHLEPTQHDFLFPKRKQRFEEGVYVANPVLGPARDEVLLTVDVGPVSDPEETFNLDGWKSVLSTPEERAALGPGQKLRFGDPVQVTLSGKLEFADGSMVLSGLALPDSEVTRISTLSLPGPVLAALQDPIKRAQILSRFDLRVELEWSARIYFVLVLFFLLGFPAAVLMSMYRPIVCEVVDLDEQRVGTRREAMYFGVEGLLTKMADGISAVVAPALMLVGHVIAPYPFGYVFPFVASTAFMVLAFAAFYRYPLGKPTPR